MNTQDVYSLSVVIDKNSSELISTLVLGGADVNESMENGLTPLQYAAEMGAADCVLALLAAGADADLSYTGLKPLGRAAVQGHAECVALLLSGGASLQPISTGNALVMAARAGHADCVRELLVYGSTFEYLYAALKAAVERHHTACAEMLATECSMMIGAGEDIVAEIKRSLNDSALQEFALQPDILALLSAPHRPVTVMQAVCLNDMQALKGMLAAGAPLCMVRMDYICPSSLYYAIEELENHEMADMLIAAGADIHSLGLLDDDEEDVDEEV